MDLPAKNKSAGIFPVFSIAIRCIPRLVPSLSPLRQDNLKHDRELVTGGFPCGEFLKIAVRGQDEEGFSFVFSCGHYRGMW